MFGRDETKGGRRMAVSFDAGSSVCAWDGLVAESVFGEESLLGRSGLK